jgi:hypothetical protein
VAERRERLNFDLTAATQRLGTQETKVEPIASDVPATHIKTDSSIVSTFRKINLPTRLGFGPVPNDTQGKFHTYVVLPTSSTPVEITAMGERLYFSNPALGSISCKGLSVSSEGASAVDPSGATIVGVDRISINSSSGSMAFYGEKQNRRTRDELRASLERLCSP